MTLDESLLSQIDSLIQESRAELASDIIRLVNIKSVPSTPDTGAPFGIGPKQVLDTFRDTCQNLGLYCTDYGMGVVSAAMNAGQPDLGIWLHGDVVPEGEGWSYDPYDATEYEGCIIGRGSTDNKGQLAAVYHVFRIFQQLGIQLTYNPAIYLGSNEETGMADLKSFLNTCTPPRLSLVPDSGFPVGYGGKGGANFVLRSKSPLHGFSITAGSSDSPGKATAIFDSATIPECMEGCTIVKGEKTEISTFTPPRHASKPDPSGNMITLLSAALLDKNLVCNEDRYILEFFQKVSLDIHGELFHIATTHDIMGPLTVFSKEIRCDKNHPELSLNIRYPLGITFETIEENIRTAANTYGFTVASAVKGICPYMQDPNSEVVQTLYHIANEITGSTKEPYTLSGATYAHLLPNALVFGMNGCQPPEDFPKDRGGAHGIDECVSLDRLERAMRIYAQALLALNEINW